MDEEEEESLQLQRTVLPLQGRYYRATGTTGILPTDLRESPLLEVRYYRPGTGTTGQPVLPPEDRYYRTCACLRAESGNIPLYLILPPYPFVARL